jgi:hypothetical protein
VGRIHTANRASLTFSKPPESLGLTYIQELVAEDIFTDRSLEITKCAIPSLWINIQQRFSIRGETTSHLIHGPRELAILPSLDLFSLKSTDPSTSFDSRAAAALSGPKWGFTFRP